MADIEIHHVGLVRCVALSRPRQRNALTDVMFVALADTLRDAEVNPDVAVVLIHGSAQCFTAGYDLHALQAAPPPGQDSAVWQFLTALEALSKPLLAAPCGAAVGIGTTMLLHSDAVYAGDNARFALPFVPLGLCPEAAASVLLPARVGTLKAAEWLLWGQAFSAPEALAHGLVNAVMPADEVLPYALARATQLAALPQEAVRATKRLLRQATRPAVQTALRDEAAVFAYLLQHDAAQQALQTYAARGHGPASAPS